MYSVHFTYFGKHAESLLFAPVATSYVFEESGCSDVLKEAGKPGAPAVRTHLHKSQRLAGAKSTGGSRLVCACSSFRSQ